MDKGGEFTSSKFNSYCEEDGIKRQLTTQQNGVAKRRNRTIRNMVRSILVDKDLPKMLWGETVQWTFYVLNRSTTTAITNKTPHEA